MANICFDSVKCYCKFIVDYALEAVEDLGPSETEVISKAKTLQELCIITVPSIVFTIEAGVGNKTLPMLMLETGFQGSAKNWSSQVCSHYYIVLTN